MVERCREAYREDGLCMRRVVHEEGTHDGLTLLGWPVFTDQAIGLAHTRTSTPSSSPPWASLSRRSWLAPTPGPSAPRTVEIATNYHKTATREERQHRPGVRPSLVLPSLAHSIRLVCLRLIIIDGPQNLWQNISDNVRLCTIERPPPILTIATDKQDVSTTS
jgi:hypothetical protein